MKIVHALVLLTVLFFTSIPVFATELMSVNIAEGFTSESNEVGIKAAHRMFSAPMFADLCPPLKAPAKLELLAPIPLQLHRGQWFSYDQLVLVALDSSGLILPPVPITVEVDNTTTPVLDLHSDTTAGSEVLPILAGKFKFRFRTICENHSAVAIVVEAEVIEP